MRRIKTPLAAVAIIITAVFSCLSKAEETKDIISETDGVSKVSDTGWKPVLKLHANFALGQSKNVPGSTDGVTTQFGYFLNSEVNYLSYNKLNEWTNELLLELGFAKTPVVDAWIKSIDTIDYKTMYLYHIPKIPWLGPYAGFRLTTSMLRTYDIRAEPVNILKLETDEDQSVDVAGNPLDEAGTPITPADSDQYESGEKFMLTGAFAPLTLRESAGMIAVSVKKEKLNLSARIGLSAWETFVRNGYTIDDNEGTPDYLEIRQIEDTVQIGTEFGIVADGLFKKDLLSYKLSALFMQPFKHNSETDLKGIELINMEFEAMLGINIFEFLSINYSFKAYKQPLIVKGWQIQNNLLIALGFDLIG